MGKFKYKCYFCFNEDEYNDHEKFCGFCGNPIKKDIINMENEAKRLKDEIDSINNSINEFLLKYCDLSVESKAEEMETYEKINNILNSENITNLKNIKDENDKKNKIISIVDSKLEKEGVIGRKIFIMDSPFKAKWNGDCKRLFPYEKFGQPISATHTYNGYLCNKNKKNFMTADVLDIVYLSQNNNVFVEDRDNGLKLFVYSRLHNKKGMETKVFPPLGIQIYGIDKVESLYDVQYSEENSDKSQDYYYVKVPAIVENNLTYYELREKGIIEFISKDQYDIMEKYYDEISRYIVDYLSADDFKGIDYYDKLNEMYNKYSAFESVINLSEI